MVKQVLNHNNNYHLIPRFFFKRTNVNSGSAFPRVFCITFPTKKLTISGFCFASSTAYASSFKTSVIMSDNVDSSDT